MCGIFGIIFREKENILPENFVRDITATMQHRGPDDEGVFIDKNVALGHRRLKIIDLYTGHQPIFNEDKSICIIFNGEIYNFKELKDILIKKGHTFTTKTDTEVIVHGYEEWDKDVINKLEGMFAFGIYDKNKKLLLIARDRLGIKPLYFFSDDKKFIFASEIKAILTTLLIPPKINYDMIDFFISLGYIPAPQSIFKDIYKLEPGHFMLINKDGDKKYKYWELLKEERLELSFNESCEKLIELLSECINSHLISDVPLGVFLSGGIDSSSVVGLMSKRLNLKPKTFSIGYEDEDISELRYAKRIANEFNTEHYEFILKPMNFFDSIKLFLYYIEEPIIESAAIALYQLAKTAKANVTVLLSGEGADELFAGYPIHRWVKNIERSYQLLKFIPYIKKLKLFSLPEKYQKYLYWFFTPFDKRYKTVSCDIIPQLKDVIYNKEFREIVGKRVENFFIDVFSKYPQKTILQKMLYVDTRYWLVDDLLLKADKMTMATSVELRVPFLDHKLVEFAFSLPDEYKINKKEGKFILKKAIEVYLPKDIIYRKKRGFPVPISKWFTNELYNIAEEILLDKKTINRGYFNKKYLIHILHQHKTGKEDFSRRIFSFIIFELWHRMYIDEWQGLKI